MLAAADKLPARSGCVWRKAGQGTSQQVQNMVVTYGKDSEAWRVQGAVTETWILLFQLHKHEAGFPSHTPTKRRCCNTERSVGVRRPPASAPKDKCAGWGP